MNEQIKLPVQEWLGYDPERGDMHGYTFEQMREFAELIIEKCLNNEQPEQEPATLEQYYAKHGVSPIATPPRTAQDDKYDELLFAVGNKYPGETRHETALRYIRQAEQSKPETDSGKAVTP